MAALLAQYRSQVITVAGWIIIALGIFTALGGGFRIPGMDALSGKARGKVFLLGAVYGFAGFCAGPLLGAVLTTAAASCSALYGGLIMVAYAAGVADAWVWFGLSLAATVAVGVKAARTPA